MENHLNGRIYHYLAELKAPEVCRFSLIAPPDVYCRRREWVGLIEFPSCNEKEWQCSLHCRWLSQYLWGIMLITIPAVQRGTKESGDSENSGKTHVIREGEGLVAATRYEPLLPSCATAVEDYTGLWGRSRVFLQSQKRIKRNCYAAGREMRADVVESQRSMSRAELYLSAKQHITATSE